MRPGGVGLVLISGQSVSAGIWSPVKAVIYNVTAGREFIQLKVNKLTYNGIIDMFIILTDLGRWQGWSLTRHRLYRFYLHIDCVSQCISV